MPRLKVLSGREIAAILQQHGFEWTRQKGSHMIYRREGQSGSISIPVPDHREVAIGTLQDIIRRSKLPRELFETP